MTIEHYEAHITSEVAHATVLARIANKFGWKTSEIARDPVLGNATYFYLTKHGVDPGQLHTEMARAAAVMEYLEVPVIRLKIEKIMFDSKRGDL